MVRMSKDSLGHFSRREQQIINGLLRAHSIKEIAFNLDLSSNTVKDYLKMIYVKLDVHSARELYLKLAGDSQGHAPARVCEAILKVLSARTRAELDSAILTAVTGCTGARQASAWLLDQSDRAPCVRQMVESRPCTPMPMNAFLHSVFDEGSAHITAGPYDFRQQRLFHDFGFNGDIVGACMISGTDRYALIAADPINSQFGDTEIEAMCALARIAEFRMGSANLDALAPRRDQVPAPD